MHYDKAISILWMVHVFLLAHFRQVYLSSVAVTMLSAALAAIRQHSRGAGGCLWSIIGMGVLGFTAAHANLQLLGSILLDIGGAYVVGVLVWTFASKRRIEYYHHYSGTTRESVQYRPVVRWP